MDKSYEKHYSLIIPLFIFLILFIIYYIIYNKMRTYYIWRSYLKIEHFYRIPFHIHCHQSKSAILQCEFYLEITKIDILTIQIVWKLSISSHILSRMVAMVSCSWTQHTTHKTNMCQLAWCGTWKWQKGKVQEFRHPIVAQTDSAPPPQLYQTQCNRGRQKYPETVWCTGEHVSGSHQTVQCAYQTSEHNKPRKK